MSALSFENPLTTWIISDTHAFHKNICKGLTNWEAGSTVRDYDCETKMTEDMAAVINKCVLPEHYLIHLGDWSFGGFDKIERFRKMLNCKNIYLICGNHDHHIESDRDACRSLFNQVFGIPGVSMLVDVRVGQHKYVCGHYKMAVWDKSHKGVRNLWGHSHGSMPIDRNLLSFDCGWDVWGKPLNFVEVEEEMSKHSFVPVDHHDKETN